MKKLWIIFLTCISFVCIAFATSCDKTKLAFNEGYLDEVDNKKVQEYKAGWFEHFEANMPELDKRLNEGDKLSDEDKDALRAQLEAYGKTL